MLVLGKKNSTHLSSFSDENLKIWVLCKFDKFFKISEIVWVILTRYVIMIIFGSIFIVGYDFLVPILPLTSFGNSKFFSIYYTTLNHIYCKNCGKHIQLLFCFSFYLHFAEWGFPLWFKTHSSIDLEMIIALKNSHWENTRKYWSMWQSNKMKQVIPLQPTTLQPGYIKLMRTSERERVRKHLTLRKRKIHYSDLAIVNYSSCFCRFPDPWTILK